MYGLDLSLYAEESGRSGGGGQHEGYSAAGMKYANVTDKGTDPLTITFDISTTDRDDFERILKEFNQCPNGAEVCYLSSDRAAYVEKASIAPDTPSMIWLGGQKTWNYKASAEVVCRDVRTLGTPSGSLVNNASLPASLAITNAGHHSSGLDYLMMSGGYDGRYTTDLRMELAGETIDLCRKLMRCDKWQMGRCGDILHSYETSFEKTESELAIDLHGGVDLGSGSTDYEACEIGSNGQMLIPFFGPIASSRAPYMELQVTSLAGAPHICYALSGDTDDIITTDHILRSGKNKIRMPSECVGEDLIYVGVQCDGNSFIELSYLYAEVQRHISENVLPTIEPDDTGTITIAGANMCNGYLDQLFIRYRDIF